MAAPGKNPNTADQKDLLISSDAANLAYILNGIVTLNPNDVTTVLFDEQLSAEPVPLHSFSDGEIGYLPQWQVGKLDVINRAGSPPRYTIKAQTDRLVITQKVRASYQVRFIVTSVPVG